MTRRAFGLATLAVFVAQPVAADEFIFKGDCDRARIVKTERTIDKLLPYNTYKGVQRMNYGTDSCRRDSAHFYYLTKTERSSTRMVFSVNRVGFMLFPATGSCASPERWGADVNGTVTLDLRLRELGGGLCELYVWTDWKLRETNTTWTGNFATQMIPTDGGSFVLAQGAPSSGKFFTPLAFSGL